MYVSVAWYRTYVKPLLPISSSSTTTRNHPSLYKADSIPLWLVFAICHTQLWATQILLTKKWILILLHLSGVILDSYISSIKSLYVKCPKSTLHNELAPWVNHLIGMHENCTMKINHPMMEINSRHKIFGNLSTSVLSLSLYCLCAHPIHL